MGVDKTLSLFVFTRQVDKDVYEIDSLTVLWLESAIYNNKAQNNNVRVTIYYS